VFASVASISSRGGLFVLSVERWVEESEARDFIQQEAGKFALGAATHRYQHNTDYVLSSASKAGFGHVGSKETVGRYEKGAPVAHHVFLFRQNNL
jgi:predicted TPR repeat methyltransferase